MIFFPSKPRTTQSILQFHRLPHYSFFLSGGKKTCKEKEVPSAAPSPPISRWVPLGPPVSPPQPSCPSGSLDLAPCPAPAVPSRWDQRARSAQGFSCQSLQPPGPVGTLSCPPAHECVLKQISHPDAPSTSLMFFMRKAQSRTHVC